MCSKSSVNFTAYKYAFLSRHTPTQEQHALAMDQGITLVHKGDQDAFSKDLPNELRKLQLDGYRGIVCVHALIAMKALKMGLNVGVFENSNRAPEGAPPSFLATALVVEQSYYNGCSWCDGSARFEDGEWDCEWCRPLPADYEAAGLPVPILK